MIKSVYCNKFLLVVEGGQNYDNWIHGAGKKIFQSWSARAASKGIDSDPIHQLVAPVPMMGVPLTARGGQVPTGVSQTKSSGVGRPADHPAGLAGGQPLASGSGLPTLSRTCLCRTS